MLLACYLWPGLTNHVQGTLLQKGRVSNCGNIHNTLRLMSAKAPDKNVSIPSLSTLGNMTKH